MSGAKRLRFAITGTTVSENKTNVTTTHQTTLSTLSTLSTHTLSTLSTHTYTVRLVLFDEWFAMFVFEASQEAFGALVASADESVVVVLRRIRERGGGAWSSGWSRG